VAGRWSLLPRPVTDPTRRASALAETLLDRHGLVTRGAVVAENAPGGFAAAYKVLSVFEETGRVRRGYFVEGLGAAQFAVDGAVDRLRALHRPLGDTVESGTPGATRAVVLAAADPANPYGAALPWPDRDPGRGQGKGGKGAKGAGHRPGRKAGSLVVLVDGELVLYLERGGRSLLSWTDDGELLRPAVQALATGVREGALGKLTVERTDGEEALSSPLGRALEEAGFHATPQGLRLRL
jgi:ATP-dependent Lhr-like helicase